MLASPDAVKSPERPARAGDLVVLGSALDPRVRVALEVVPANSSQKLTVFEAANEDGERHFLTTHVTFTGWSHTAVAPKRAAGG